MCLVTSQYYHITADLDSSSSFRHLYLCSPNATPSSEDHPPSYTAYHHKLCDPHRPHSKQHSPSLVSALPPLYSIFVLLCVLQNRRSEVRSQGSGGDVTAQIAQRPWFCLVGKRKRRKVKCSDCLRFVSRCDSVVVGYAIETKQRVSQMRHPSLSRFRVNPWC